MYCFVGCFMSHEPMVGKSEVISSFDLIIRHCGAKIPKKKKIKYEIWYPKVNDYLSDAIKKLVFRFEELKL